MSTSAKRAGKFEPRRFPVPGASELSELFPGETWPGKSERGGLESELAPSGRSSSRFSGSDSRVCGRESSMPQAHPRPPPVVRVCPAPRASDSTITVASVGLPLQ